LIRDRLVRVDGAPLPESAEAQRVESFDGAPLRVTHFGGTGDRGTALIVPGWTEFTEKYGEVALDLMDRGFDVWAYDPRGQGLSLRLTDGDERGRVDEFSKHIGDLRAVVDHLDADRLTLVSHSMGGLITLSWLMEGGQAEAAVMSGPATRIYPSVFQRVAVRGVARLLKVLGRQDLKLSNPENESPDVKDSRVTSDPDRHQMHRDLLKADSYLGLPVVTPAFAGAMHAQQAKLHEPGALSMVTTPIAIVSMPDDEIVNSADHHRLAGLYPDLITVTDVPDAKHEVLMEQDTYRDQFWDLFDSFTDLHVPKGQEEAIST